MNDNTVLQLPLDLSEKPTPQQPKPLRPYQVELINKVFESYENGKRSLVAYCPTGGGKTFISIEIITKFLQSGKKVLFCCHRKKLVDQTVASVKNRINLTPEILWRGKKADYSAQMFVGMIGSLSYYLDKLPKIDLIVVDECHTVTYYQVFKDLRQKYFIEDDCKILGLTATPWRRKLKENLADFYDDVVGTVSLADLVFKKYLAKPRMFGYKMQKPMEHSSKDGSTSDDYFEFTQEMLQDHCDDEFHDNVVKKFIEVCRENKAVCYCINVDRAEYLKNAFRDHGIRAKTIVGSTPEAERDIIFQEFKEGKFQVLCSVGCLTEGYDEPTIETVIIARPTRSKSLFVQMAGRGLRMAPNKTEAIIMDFGDNIGTFGHLEDLGIPTYSELQLPKWEKVCPSCKVKISFFARICPKCGYEYPPPIYDNGSGSSSQSKPEFDWFGEITPLSREAALYLRSRKYYCYKENISVLKAYKDLVDFNLNNRIKTIIRPEWTLNSVFNNKNYHEFAVNARHYRDYLKNHLLKEIIRLEKSFIMPEYTLDEWVLSELKREFQDIIFEYHYPIDGIWKCEQRSFLEHILHEDHKNVLMDKSFFASYYKKIINAIHQKSSEFGEYFVKNNEDFLIAKLNYEYEVICKKDIAIQGENNG